MFSKPETVPPRSPPIFATDRHPSPPEVGFEGRRRSLVEVPIGVGCSGSIIRRRESFPEGRCISPCRLRSRFRYPGILCSPVDETPGRASHHAPITKAVPDHVPNGRRAIDIPYKDNRTAFGRPRRQIEHARFNDSVKRAGPPADRPEDRSGIWYGASGPKWRRRDSRGEPKSDSGRFASGSSRLKYRGSSGTRRRVPGTELPLK
jgi:hypothetical protein